MLRLYWRHLEFSKTQRASNWDAVGTIVRTSAQLAAYIEGRRLSGTAANQ